MTSIRTVCIYVTDFGEIEFANMTPEQAEGRYRAMVTRDWWLLGDKTEAEIRQPDYYFEYS